MNNFKRPKMLTWLCAGSIIFGVSWFVMLLLLLISETRGAIPTHLFPGLVIEYAAAGKLFIASQMLLTGLGIGAVIMMWQMKKAGFYLYASIKTMVYFMPAFLIGPHHLTFPALIITSILICAYGIFFTGKGNPQKKQEKE